MNDCICNSCELGKYSNPIFGYGNIKSRIVIVGTSPSKDSIIAKNLLDGIDGKVLDMALKESRLSTDSVYITNIVNCNSNKSLNEEEMLNCTKLYLEPLLKKIDPYVIIALGATAIKYFTGDTDVNSSRFKKIYILPYRFFSVIPTFSPSYLIRNGIYKKDDVVGSKKIELFNSFIEDFNRAVSARDIYIKNRGQ